MSEVTGVSEKKFPKMTINGNHTQPGIEYLHQSNLCRTRSEFDIFDKCNPDVLDDAYSLRGYRSRTSADYVCFPDKKKKVALKKPEKTPFPER